VSSGVAQGPCLRTAGLGYPSLRARQAGEAAAVVLEGIELGAISMLSVRVG